MTEYKNLLVEKRGTILIVKVNRERALNALNKEILMQLHEQGIAAPSYTTLNDRYCLRIAISNHRSTLEDFDLLAREVVRLGNEISARA